MIAEEQAEAAVDWLRDNAEEAGQAAAEKDYLDDFLKVRLASIMRECVGESNAAAQTRALCDPRYLEILEARKIAHARHEKFRWLKTAAEAKIEAWRTQQSNQRALGKL
jgi:hypothetical protein